MVQALSDKIAVVTGASTGIGKAITLALAAKKVHLCLIGRNLEKLEEVAVIARNVSPQALCYCIDLTIDQDIYKLKEHIEQDFGQIDLLIHNAAAYSMGTLQSSSVEQLDRLYQHNLRAPYFLTKTLLPLLLTRGGQIVFMNSSAVMKARDNLGQYTATKQGLKAIADSLREEVNVNGIKVLSIFPGRTATPTQAKIFEMEGRKYHPENLLQPEDIATTLINILSLPQTAEVTDIYIRPFKNFDQLKFSKR